MRCYSWHRESYFGPSTTFEVLIWRVSSGEPRSKTWAIYWRTFPWCVFFLNIEVCCFFFLILNWAVIWVKINKKNLKVKAARVVSNQWVTLPTATPSGCSFILLPVRGKRQGGLGRLTSSVAIAVTVRKGVMDWNFTGVSLLWSGGGAQDQCSLFKRPGFLIPCHPGQTEQLPSKNLKRAVFIAMSLNSCAWVSTLLVQVLAT